jgi:hypothetical protein
MTRTTALAILLRVLGIAGLFALVAVAMPMSWMVQTHRWLGLGEMPSDPVVEYLARSVSLAYALFGAFFLVLAADLERYRPLVRWLGVLIALLGAVLLGVDVRAGMPTWWIAVEGPFSIGCGLLIYYLAGRKSVAPAGRK